MTGAADRRSWLLVGVLVCLGAGWGLTQPLGKIAVSEGYRHFGLVFWQLAIGAMLLGGITLARRRPVPMGRHYLRLYALLALIGTVLPNAASYQAAVHLPSGVLSVVISLVPILSFPIALGLGIDRFAWRRLIGLFLGLGGVAVLSLPGAAVPEPGLLIWLPVAALAPLLYATEGNIVAKWGTLGLDPVQTLAGVSIVGTVLCAPLALTTGSFIVPGPEFGPPDAALVLSAIIHALVYSGFVWLLGRAGSVFAAQVAYLVTGFGVLWAMLLLGERYSAALWIALALMLAGLFLVQPRPARRDAHAR